MSVNRAFLSMLQLNDGNSSGQRENDNIYKQMYGACFVFICLKSRVCLV